MQHSMMQYITTCFTIYNTSVTESKSNYVYIHVYVFIYIYIYSYNDIYVHT